MKLSLLIVYTLDKNQPINSGQAQQNSLPDPTPSNWQQPSNPAPRPGPTVPGATQPLPQEINTAPGQQRTLAWTGQLEWQDTVSENCKIFFLDNNNNYGPFYPCVELFMHIHQTVTF